MCSSDKILLPLYGKEKTGGSAKSLNKCLARFCVTLRFLYLRA